MALLQLTKDKKELFQEICKTLVNLPYRFGAEVDLRLKPEEVKQKGLAFDCSELVKYVYYQLGYKVPDGSANQYYASDIVSVVETGDLVFKQDRKNKIITHVGMVFDEKNNTVIEAEGWWGKVIIRDLDNFKLSSSKNEYAGLRRFNMAYIKVL